jgi:hypothetical protein
MSNTDLDQLRQLGCVVSLTGSLAICNPPPTDTDEDWLVETPTDLDGKTAGPVLKLLSLLRYELESNPSYPDQESLFQSWRKGSVNLLLTYNREFAANHKKATAYCKEKNLLNKKDRIAAFQWFLYGNGEPLK